MISFKHKFIFVHVYKAAGTTVKNVLRPYAKDLSKPQRMVNRLSRRFGGPVWFPPLVQPARNHATATEYKAYLGEEAYATFFKFAFVRNPYDWLVSLYEYVRQNPKHHHHELYLKMSFAEFIAWRCGEARELQNSFVLEDGKIIVDFIGRFENLKADFATALARAGVVGELKHLNPSKRRPYREYYDATTQRLVAEAYAEDFELFGYSKEI